MRTVLSALSILLAVLLTGAAVPSLWIDRNVVDEGGFVHLLEPLRNDAEFQTALGTSLASTVVSASNVPAALQPAATGLAKGIVTSLTTDPGYPAAWDEAVRESHRLNFSAVTATTGFTLELRPLAGVMLARMGSSLGVSLGEAPSIEVPVGTAQQRSWLTVMQDAGRLAVPLSLGAVFAFVLGLLFARRRGVALGWAGLGLLLVAALLAAGTFLASMFAGGQGGAGTVASVFARRLGPLFSDSFMPWTGAVAIAGVVCLVLSFVAGVRRRRAAARR
ncbi:hypothetical protein RBS60_13110 [Sinomonas sp. ASV486]|uniref:hypothetical protein n=1 Tax=Sinomonas sp. ASV486 TaxID=3051170 RepID=UPI0027DBE708|nr:hypothetical protein [Sinomonas sp. ASV486]MDQ4491136.1 hypothetical protein [Sinomonas sp. ASV486]